MFNEDSQSTPEKMAQNIITLDQAVINALEFFQANPPPEFKPAQYKFPLVVGSGNAFNTGQILFGGQAAVLADESNFRKILEGYKDLIKKKEISQAIVISSSGEKDSIWETELAKKNGLKTTLLTCKPNSSAAQIADKVIAFRSVAEPYTYNTSTYLGMILAASRENPKEILNFIKQIKLPPEFPNYKSYAFLLPDEFSHLCPMLDIKKDELFGPNLSLRAFTQGHARHAKFVHPTPDELIIAVGTENKFFGNPQHRLFIGLPEQDHGTALAATYFITGKIQEAKPPYFKDNIGKFCQEAPAAYGSEKPFNIIVPGN